MVGGAPTMPGKPGDQPSAARPGDPNTAGPMPLRRLTRREYNNTIRDLLGDTSRPADGFPPDQESDFTFRRAGLVATVDATRLGGAAETLADAAEARFATLVPCAPAAPADEEPCARKFIESFGLRAYRRPLEPDEVERHLKLYRDGRGAAQLDHQGAIKLLIEAMLQSPHFVYRWELGPGSGQKEGTGGAPGPLRDRLAGCRTPCWGSMPDQALFDAAAGGRLATEADVEREARRLLADPRAKETLITFVEEWFGFDQLADRPKDAKLYPEWKDDLKAAMTAELRAFVGQVVFDGDAQAGHAAGGQLLLREPAAGGDLRQDRGHRRRHGPHRPEPRPARRPADPGALADPDRGQRRIAPGDARQDDLRAPAVRRAAAAAARRAPSPSRPPTG